MPRRALRCVVDLNINLVSAPGVWLPSKEDVYLSVSIFNQYRNTCCTASIFPLFFKEQFRFEKTYYTAVDPSHVAELLEDELVIFELLQLSEYTDGAVRLATFSTNARDFLYPYPSLAPSYASTDREVLMSRTIAFPGISPKLEFSTKSVIRESLSPEIDALEIALEDQRLSRRRKLRRSPSVGCLRTRCKSPSVHYYEVDREFQRPTSAYLSRSRSPSPIMRSDDLASTIDPRPPFVVRKLSTDLIGRSPGGPTAKNAKSKKKNRLLSRSPLRTSLSLRHISCPTCLDTYSEENCLVCRAYRRHMGRPYWGHSHFHHPTGHVHKYKWGEVIREPYEDPVPVYRSKYSSTYDDDDDDAEVAELTSSFRDIEIPTPRPRSVSPYLYTPSYRLRFPNRPYSPSYLSARVDRLLAKDRLERLSPVALYSRYPYYDSSLDDLALETRLARSRSLVHLDEGKYWTPNAAKLSGKTHRQVFTDTMGTIYGNLYNQARKLKP